MKKTIMIIILCLFGIGLISYPYIANYLADKNASTAIQDYEQNISENLDLQEEWEKAVAYNQQLIGGAVTDPFVPGSGMVLDQNYLNILNVNDMMGYLRIPKINVKLSMHHGTSDVVLNKGVGHLEGSSLPIGGEGTHSVLTGHTGLAHAKLFTDLNILEEGDIFFIHVLNEVLAYEVDQIKIVVPEDTEDLQLIPGEDYITLITCTPYSVNTHRLLVRGTRIEYNDNVDALAKSQTNNKLSDELMLTIIAAVATTIVMTIIIIVVLVIKKKRER